jgi:hypothetical protein
LGLKSKRKEEFFNFFNILEAIVVSSCVTLCRWLSSHLKYDSKLYVLCLCICMYKGWAIKSGPRTGTFNNLLCYVLCLVKRCYDSPIYTSVISSLTSTLTRFVKVTLCNDIIAFVFIIRKLVECLVGTAEHFGVVTLK